MADFDLAFSITSDHEGGYVSDPDDAGGETYRGIARRYHPSWSGWKIIDDLKKINPSNLNNTLKSNDGLNEAVKRYYKQFYWDRFWGDSIPLQSIANELFDTSVNLGVRRSVKYLQEGLNLLNRNQEIYTDISVDGFFGPGTLKALNRYLALDDDTPLIKLMNTLQGMHYIKYMRQNPTQEKYARGWLKRA